MVKKLLPTYDGWRNNRGYQALYGKPLMKKLEEERGKGRDDYPIRAVWSSLLAGIVYQHPSVESLRRELRRSAQLREVCGFDL